MSKKIKIVADNKIPFLRGVLEPYAEIEYYPGGEISNDKIRDADALIIRTRTNCNAELLEHSNVKLITTATIGFDHIEKEYCDRNEVKWINAPGCNSNSVMQYFTSAILNIAQSENINLAEKKIGIVGVGNVGRKIQKVSKILGMSVLLNDPPRERVEGHQNFCDLENIISDSDIISFHVPLNKEGIDKTLHLADEDFFNLLKKKPIIINSSRGEVVKTLAIKKALQGEQVSNVVLDVWENEPEIDLELLELVDFGTPHIAGYSADGKANGTSVCVNTINKFFNLGLSTNWYPENIPLAKNGNKIKIDCDNREDQEVISEVISATYSIALDDETLRNSPETFEFQRGNYPIRREFQNYSMQLNDCNSEVVNTLVKMGFKNGDS